MTEEITEERLAALEKLVSEATPGPWVVARNMPAAGGKLVLWIESDHPGFMHDADFDDSARRREDARFIAAMRTEGPELIAAVRALLAERDEAVGDRDAFDSARIALVSELDAVTAERDRLLEQKDIAYAERDRCVAVIAQLATRLGWRAGLGQHSAEDTTWDHDWRTIVFVDLPTGQASWHVHDSERAWFSLPPYAGAWDGHSTEEKYRRCAALAEPPSGGA